MIAITVMRRTTSTVMTMTTTTTTSTMSSSRRKSFLRKKNFDGSSTKTFFFFFLRLVSDWWDVYTKINSFLCRSTFLRRRLDSGIDSGSKMKKIFFDRQKKRLKSFLTFCFSFQASFLFSFFHLRSAEILIVWRLESVSENKLIMSYAMCYL